MKHTLTILAAVSFIYGAEKTALVTGVTGQDGSYLTELLLEKGFKFEKVFSNKKKTSICLKSNRFVIINVRAGLGNQLFHYAAGYALGKRINAEIIIVGEDNEDTKDSNSRNQLLMKFNIEYDFFIKQSSFGLSDHVFIVTDVNFTNLRGEESQFYALGFLHSFYENSRFFYSHIEEIRFMISPFFDESKSSLIKKQMDQFENSVALHIRRGDFTQYNYQLSIPITYYVRAIQIMKEKYANAHFFVFSDSPKEVESFFIHLNNFQMVSDGTLTIVQEFFLLSYCKHLITANSTFSCWAGLIKKTGDIIVPNPIWFNYSLDGNRYPDNWIQLNPFEI